MVSAPHSNSSPSPNRHLGALGSNPLELRAPFLSRKGIGDTMKTIIRTDHKWKNFRYADQVGTVLCVGA